MKPCWLVFQRRRNRDQPAPVLPQSGDQGIQQREDRKGGLQDHSSFNAVIIRTLGISSLRTTRSISHKPTGLIIQTEPVHAFTQDQLLF